MKRLYRLYRWLAGPTDNEQYAARRRLRAMARMMRKVGHG
jgi:hypothetical protein